MMPEESVYGEWPKSGEIDIMESRGNDRGYSGDGRNVFLSTLHWGKSFPIFRSPFNLFPLGKDYRN